MTEEQIGSQGNNDPGAQEPQGVENNGPEETSINPAWQPLLEKLPSQFHSTVTPHFQEWDRNYQQGLQKVHSQYEGWKPFIDNGVEPDQVEYALSILNAIQEDPQQVVKALQEYFPGEETPPVNEPPSQEQGQQSSQFDFNSVPELQQMKQMVDTMAQFLVQQKQSETERQESERLEAERKRLSEEHGEFDQTWVAAQMLANDKMSMEDAVKAYKTWETNLVNSRLKPGPKVIGAGGAAPNSQVEPKKLDDAGRRDLVKQMLAQAAEQNRGG